VLKMVFMALMILIPGAVVLSLLLRAVWITISCYYLTPRRIRRVMAEQGVHGPAPRFLVGNLKDIAVLVKKTTSDDMEVRGHDIVGRLMPHYVLWSKTYGASWLQQQGSKHFVGQGLLMANGHSWFHQRRIVSPAFMADRLKLDLPLLDYNVITQSHAGYMVTCTKKMIKSLHDAIATGDDEVEIGGYLTRLTGDIISRTEFDSSYEKGRRMFQLLESLQSLTARSSRYLWIPGSRFLPSRFRREIKEMKVRVERLLMEIIQSSKDGVEIGRSSSYGRGLLGMLLSEAQKKREGFSYSLPLVMDECKTFFFAGHETSALLLTWTVMLLATNPTWQERARAEVEQVCGDDPPSSEHLPKLTLLTMIINESLRLYPPATLLPRMVFEDIKLGDLHIPKGLSIWIPVLAIHHDATIWGEDVHEFNPERFAGRSFALTRHFLPFASGPRNCVGQAYAMMEAKIILAMLLSSFSFAISDNYRHAPINVLTLKPKYGVPVYLRPLRH
ncbi:hypothetical protein GW17_00007737, partial [Ensete ventricosum]